MVFHKTEDEMREKVDRKAERRSRVEAFLRKRPGFHGLEFGPSDICVFDDDSAKVIVRGSVDFDYLWITAGNVVTSHKFAPAVTPEDDTIFGPPTD